MQWNRKKKAEPNTSGPLRRVAILGGDITKEYNRVGYAA
jgi:hypothetical protein